MREIDGMRQLLERGHISRRDFNTRLLSLGLTTAAAGSVLAEVARAAAPKKGGRIRIGVGGGATGDSLSPGLAVNQMLQVTEYGLRNCLVEIDAGTNPVPELAESWEPSPDAKTWTFKLRKGVEFHNGKTLDMKDVLYSINLHRKEDSKSPVKALLKQIESIGSDGDQIRFELKAGSADFPYILAVFNLQIVPDGTTDFSDGMGTGGYRLENFEPGVRSHLKRVPNYWKEGRAHFDEVEILSLNDTTARVSALMSGDVDVIDTLAPKTVKLLKRRDDIEVTAIQGMQHYVFPMRTDTAPFDNNDVRLALKYAIDRQELVDKVLGGYGALGNDHPISPANRFFAADLPQRAYDPEKARFHLKKAGMEGLKVDLSAAEAAFVGAVDAVALYREHAAKAGIDIRVIREPNDGYWSNVWMKKPWCASVWYGRPTEDWMFSTVYAADAPYNESFWKHERFNKLLVEARTEFDTEKRRAMYRDMQEISRDEGGTLIPMFASFLEAHSRKITSGAVAQNYPLDGLRIAERWWMA